MEAMQKKLKSVVKINKKKIETFKTRQNGKLQKENKNANAL